MVRSEDIIKATKVSITHSLRYLIEVGFLGGSVLREGEGSNYTSSLKPIRIMLET